MSRILITGATGNIGAAVIQSLFDKSTEHTIIAGVRDVERAKKQLGSFEKLKYKVFDFEDSSTYQNALQNIDTVFLLRPPHISDVSRYFKPLLEEVREQGIRNIVFLSVQGVEKSKVIPHNKIERLIREQGFDFIFLRPSYFMQNLTTTLADDIKNKREIILPAGNARFNWVDANDVGEVAALMLDQFSSYRNKSFDITGYENMTFGEVTSLINAELTGQPVAYRRKGPIQFYLLKKAQGVKPGYIFVLLMLHYLPRFQKEPEVSVFFEELTGKKPCTVQEFIKREINHFN